MDGPRLLLLLFLYVLQGIPFALLQQSLPALLAQSMSFADLGILSFAMLPFAMKIFFAPLVDSLWTSQLGQRRSWVVPCTAATGILWHLLGQHIDAWMATQSTGMLSAALFAIVLLLAAQDAAVDAWALELLSKKNLAYASVCQSTGLGLGNLLGHPVLLLVTEPSGVFCHFVGDDPMLSFPRFLTVLAGLHMLVALAAALTHEESTAATTPPPPHAAVASAAEVAAAPAATTSHLRKVFRQLWSMTSSPSAVCAIVFLLLQRVCVATLDAAAVPFYMRLHQARQSHLTLLAALHAPVGIPSAIIAARAISSSEMQLLQASTRLMRFAHGLLLLCSASCPFVLLSHDVTSLPRNVLLVALSCAFVGVNKLWWTAQSTAFNAIALEDAEVRDVRASYLALFSSLSMAGKLWPTPFALLATDHLGFGWASLCFLCIGGVAAPVMDSALRRLPNGLSDGQTKELAASQQPSSSVTTTTAGENPKATSSTHSPPKRITRSSDHRAPSRTKYNQLAEPVVRG